MTLAPHIGQSQDGSDKGRDGDVRGWVGVDRLKAAGRVRGLSV